MALIEFNEDSYIREDDAVLADLANQLRKAGASGKSAIAPGMLARAIVRASQDPDYKRDMLRAIQANKWPRAMLGISRRYERMEEMKNQAPQAPIARMPGPMAGGMPPPIGQGMPQGAGAGGMPAQMSWMGR